MLVRSVPRELARFGDVHERFLNHVLRGKHGLDRKLVAFDRDAVIGEVRDRVLRKFLPEVVVVRQLLRQINGGLRAEIEVDGYLRQFGSSPRELSLE